MFKFVKRWTLTAACVLSFCVVVLLNAVALMRRSDPSRGTLVFGDRLMIGLAEREVLLSYRIPRPLSVGPVARPWSQRSSGPARSEMEDWLKTLERHEYWNCAGMHGGRGASIRRDAGHFVSDSVFRTYAAPDLYVIAAAGVLPLYTSVRSAARRRLATRRMRRGRCGACGYDLRGGDSTRCPECGAHFIPARALSAADSVTNVVASTPSACAASPTS